MKESKMFLGMHKVPFGRAGAFMTFYLEDLAEEGFGMPKVWFGSTRGGASIQGRNNNLMKFSLVWDGEEIPYALSRTPSELIMSSDHGDVRICIAEKKLVRIQGDGDVSLRIHWTIVGKHTSGKHEDARDMNNGTWMACFNWMANFLIVPINANLKAEAPWNWRETYSEYFDCVLSPAGKGNMEIAIEEFPDFDGKKRDKYPEYRDCVAQVGAEFKEFLDTTAPVIKDAEIAKARENAAYCSWSHLIGPEGLMKHRMMQMMRVYFPYSFGWQQSYQAVCLSRNIDLSWELLLNMFDQQLPSGHIPEYITDFYCHHRVSKPPLQGFAILWLLDHRDVSGISKDKIEALYNGLGKWVGWWKANRWYNGLPKYDHADESGWDDATMYVRSCPCVSPELPPYLVLCMEAESRLADMLGKKSEAEQWMKESKTLLKTFIERLWNGKQFVTEYPVTKDTVAWDSAVNFQPLILGKRLPQEIIDSIVATMKSEGYLTPYGIASERLDSKYVDPYQGWMNGPIVAPLHFQLVLGLDLCGQKEFAKEVARRFCGNCAKNGPYHIISPFTGKGQDKGRDNVLHQHWASWSTSIFMFLASEFC